MKSVLLYCIGRRERERGEAEREVQREGGRQGGEGGGKGERKREHPCTLSKND